MKSFTSVTLLLMLTAQVFGNSRTSKEVATTEWNAAKLIGAVKLYHSAYSVYPPLNKTELFDALKGKKDKVNPKGLPFWDPISHGVVNSKGEIVDGWGNPFHWGVSPDGQSLRLISKGKNGVFDIGRSEGDDLYFTVLEPKPKESIQAE